MNGRKFLPFVALVLIIWLLTAWIVSAATLSRAPYPPIPSDLAAKIEPQVLRELTGPEAARDTLRPSTAPQTTFISPSRWKRPRTRRERAPLAGLRPPEVEGRERRERLRPEQAAAIRLARRQAAVAALQATATRSQSAIRAYLDAQQVAGHVSRIIPFWIFNGLAVTGDLETVLALAARPEVEIIRANHHRILDRFASLTTSFRFSILDSRLDVAPRGVPIPDLNPIQNLKSRIQNPESVEWNISLIGADRVWQEFGVTGQGVVVANVDTGVAWTHPALRNQYRGLSGNSVDHDYNWFDFTRTYPGAPGDGHGHGTHTLGIAVGGDGGVHQIGVAPGARWIAVKVFTDGGTAEDINIHAGLQWLLAPTDLNGKNPDPARAPDVINNSWGIQYDGANPTFWDDVIALRAAGIVPIFATGNSGRLGTGSAEAPATYPESLAVGATTDADNLASFSGRGPSFWEQIKPDLTAPGVDIRSSFPTSNYYQAYSGTSMAAPHVTGLVALLLQADPTLSVDDIEAFLRHTAVDLGEPGPDNLYGAGRIDAYTAVRWALSAGKLYGLVREAASAQPVPGATVTGLRRGSAADSFTLQSDQRGVYAISVPAGTYDVTATALGYRAATLSAVQVFTGFLSVRDIHLAAMPQYQVAGQVTEAGTGRPITATVTVLETNFSSTTDAAGHYTLTLPAGVYTLKASAPRHRSQTAAVTVAAESSGFRVSSFGFPGSEHETWNSKLETLDFSLPEAPSILLVDADAGAGTPVSVYYRWALDYLGYPYSTFAVPGTTIPRNLPRLADYDLIIWAHHARAPSDAEAEDVLKAYLDGGGRLLLSGANIGQIDSETDFFRNWLHASFASSDVASQEASGVPGDIFDSLRLNLTDVFGYKNPTLLPDALDATSLDPEASVTLLYANGQVASLKTDVCRGAGRSAYRAVYLAFGFESTGPRPDHAMLLDRAIEWLSSQRPARGVGITPATGQARALPGEKVIFTRQVVNQGETSDTYRLTLSSPWPARVFDAGSGQPLTHSQELAPCSAQTLRVEIDIPPGTAVGASNTTTLRAVSETDGSVAAEATFTVMAFPNWQMEEAVPVAASRVAVAGINCTVYRIGGEGEDGSPIPNVYAYDSAARRWISRRPKPTAVSNAPAAALNGKIYVTGGFNAGPTAVVEVYDPATDAWERIAPLPEPLWGAAAAVAGGKLYVMGGTLDGAVYQAKTFAFDPQSGAWSRKANMQVPRVHLAAATVGGLIYAVGGQNEAGVDLDTVEVYDPDTNTWSLKKPLPTPRSGLGAAALGEWLYVAGGGWYSYVPAVERYDPATDTWVAVSPLQVGRRSLGLAAAGGRLYAVSGYNGDYRPTVESLTLATNLCASTKTAFPVRAGPGESVTYTVTLVNPGPETLTGVRLTDPIPPFTTFVPGSATGGATYNPILNRIEWVGDVPPSPGLPFTGGDRGGVEYTLTPVSIRYQVRLNPGLTGDTTIINTASIDDGQGVSLTRSAEVLALVPNLASSAKTVDPPRAASGDVLTYTIVLHNTNPAIARRASLVDPIPAHTRYVDGSAAGGAVYNRGQNQIEWQGDLPSTVPSQYRVARSGSPGGPTYAWTEISGSGTRLLLGDDDRAEIPLPFRFNFYGEEHTRLFVGSNGVLFFEDANLGYVNKCIPGDSGANVRTFIAPYWDDLDPGHVAAGGVFYAVQGVAPNRRLVVEWYKVPRYTAGPLTFEVILYEATGEIVFQYQDVLAGDLTYGQGRDATIGIQRDATEGLQFSCNTPSLADRLALRFAPLVVAPVLSYRVRIDDGLPIHTLITNTARIDDGTGNVYTSTATTTVNVTDFSTSRLAVDHTAASPGSLLTYRLYLSNTGNADIPTLRVLDPIPALTTYVPDSAAGGAIYDPVNHRIAWQGRLLRGTTTELRFQVRLTKPLSDGTTIVNTATLQDSQESILTRSVTTTVTAPDLGQSEKLVSAAQVTIGTPVTYLVRVRNTGTVTAQVSLLDRLPPDLTFVPNSAWAGSGEAVQYNLATQTLSWRGEVPARGVAEIGFQVVPRTTGVITNSVRLDDGAGTVVEKTAPLTVNKHPITQWYIPLIAKNDTNK